MSTLLDNSSQPLWVWIVVITVGSLLILGLTIWFIRYWILRRRIRSDIEFVSDEPAEKKLTLRRGRIVPATSYLSLTGSRFGINSYVTEDGRETPSVRSKSPFEWWASLRGRSSRLSYVSQVSSTQYPGSPRTTSFYQRSDLSSSKISLTSKNESLRATVMEVKVAKPQTLLVPSFKRSSRRLEPVNFSRSFTSQFYRPSAPHHTKTLSRISEHTPRQSMFSTASFRVRTGSIGNNEHIQIADQQVTNRASGGPFLQGPPLVNHARNKSASSSREMLQQYGHEHLNPLASHPSGLASSPYLPSEPATPTFPPAVADPASPPLPQNGLWESSMKQFPWLDHHHHHQQQQQPTPTEVTTQSQDISIDVQYTQSQAYTQQQQQPPPSWSMQSDNEVQLHQPPKPPQSQLQVPSQFPTVSGPLSTRSRKGNVLRKKSLERTKVSRVYH